MKFTSDIAAKLWVNGIDSLRHAYNHLADRNSTSDARWHDHKWLAISIHHAANCLANMWLYEYFPDSSKIANGKFPFLVNAINELSEKGQKVFKPSEIQFLNKCKKINSIRNDYYHQIPPDTLSDKDLSEFIVILAGFLRMLEWRDFEQIENIIGDYKDNFSDIFEELDPRSFLEYGKLIEALVTEKDTYYEIRECPICGTSAVFNEECQACFLRIKIVDCDLCGFSYCKSNDLDEPSSCPICAVKAWD